ncbi:FUSC family protein [Novosphingobium pituita]|uniref:FUSC family protein n=1 Tax=Novosphingobium pituita TaxID=3056842 RepID=A0ABQ6P9B4_9SPHN|nr:FUSC family protein [Novosphingobium sp. IK01]GMM61813.1 FUSC family protein [Novosphingobium sp. IK01]
MPVKLLSSIRPPNFAQLMFAFKTVLAAFLALWIGLWVGLPMSFWSMTTVFIVSNPLAGATRSKAIFRVIGTFAGAAFAVAVVPGLFEWPLLLSGVLAAWVGLCLTISLLDRSARSYTLMLAGYTAAIIAFPSTNNPYGVFDTAVARVTEITLGIVAATLTHSIIMPLSVSVPLGGRLERWMRDAETWLADCLTRDAPRRTPREQQQLAVDVVDCALMTTHVPFDTSHWREATGTVRALLERMVLLLPLLSGLSDRRAAIAAVPENPDPDLDRARMAAQDWLAAGSPSDALPDLSMADSTLFANARTADWHDLLVISYRVRLAQVVALLGECRQALNHLRDPDAPILASLRSPRAAFRLHRDFGQALMAGIAAAAAVFACCVIWIYSSWADGAGAAAMTAVFCCLFASLDNPVPMILRFGVAICLGVPMAGVYVFAILPMVHDFLAMAIVLSPPLLAIAYCVGNPRLAGQATAMAMGFCAAVSIQETYQQDFEHFINANIGQVLAVILAAGFTAGLRNLGTDVAIKRLLRSLQRDLVRLSASPVAPDPSQVLARVMDQTALLTQRLSTDTEGVLTAQEGLREVRLALNLVAIQHARTGAPLRQQRALSILLREAERYFRSWRPDAPPPPDERLLHRIDRALRLILRDGMDLDPQPLPFGHPDARDRPHAVAALIAFRRNLFPNSPSPVLHFPTTGPAELPA